MAGAIYGGGANVVLRNTIMASNTAGNPWNNDRQCSEVLTNGGNNLQYPANNPTDPTRPECLTGVQVVDPHLGALTDNGGPTWQTTSGNGPLRGGKGDVLEGGVREPFLIQRKGHLPAGKVDDEIGSLASVLRRHAHLLLEVAVLGPLKELLCPISHLFRLEPTLAPADPFARLIFQDGPVFLAYTLFTYGLIACSTILLGGNFFSSPRIYRLQVGTVLLGPIQVYLEWRQKTEIGVLHGTLLDFAAHRLSNIGPKLFGAIGYHMWFLGYLFAFSLLWFKRSLRTTH